jgi:hypothetical chaperone protein
VERYGPRPVRVGTLERGAPTRYIWEGLGWFQGEVFRPASSGTGSNVAVQLTIGYAADMKTVCGIDFGTSNSTVAIVRDGLTALVPVEEAHTTIPSAIFYPAEGTPAVYGRAAIATYLDREAGRLMRSLKSILGTELIAEKTAVGGRYQSFESILVGYVRHLKEKAEIFAADRIDEVVMGRPVHFVDGNDEVDARAESKLGDIAREAGFRAVSFQYEPIAAALSFEHTLAQEEVVLVADIGGGTADFSVVRVGPKRRGRADRSEDILANGGIRVGGTNLDMRLSMAAVMPLLGSTAKTLAGRDLPRWPFVDMATWHRIHTIATSRNLMTLQQILADCAHPDVFQRYIDVVRQQSGHLIAQRVEQAKIDLSRNEQIEINLADAVPGLRARTSKRRFEQAVSDELERLGAAVRATIAAAGIGPQQITTIFLTGGTSAVPAVKAVVTTQVPHARATEGDLFNSVGFGLALEAKRKFAR